jgi:hypothetical protein
MSNRPHVVRQGEYLSQLAFRHGFDAAEVWSAPENRELRERRTSPELLLPGDVVQVPVRPPSLPRVTLQSENRYRCHVPRAAVRVRFACDTGPLAGEACTVEGLGPPQRVTTDGDGALTLQVPAGVREVDVVLDRTGFRQKVLIGHLDPADTPSGVEQRLQNLGHVAGHDPAATVLALRAFQERSGLPITGEADAATTRALSDVHGS